MKNPLSLSQKAYEFAEMYYGGCTRRSGETLLEHAIRVQQNLKDININDEITLSAAILHDALKYTSEKEIEREFGPEICELLKLLLTISRTQIPVQSIQSSQRIPNLHKIFFHFTKDMRVLLIRLSDRLDNIKTSGSLSPEEQKWAAQVTLAIFAPISKTLGIMEFSQEMEDEAFKILEPERYKFIKKELEESLKNAQIEIELTEHKLREFIENEHIKSFEISHRTKGIYSTHKKALRRATSGKIKSIDDINHLADILGIRIIVETKDQCYKLLAFAQQHWKFVENEFDDYISNPKSSGYKSIHTAIKLGNRVVCELQIRTFEMHTDNEYGPASHLSYKYQAYNKEKNVQWIKELINVKENIQNVIAQDNKLKVFENEVFVFTPAHDIIALPKDSTSVDFAYAIHEDVGNTCFGSKINGKMVPLDATLKSGDTVEIITNKNHKPSPHWLRFIKTRTAKREITRILLTSSKGLLTLICC